MATQRRKGSRMTDLHATAAQLIVDVHDGHLLAATRQLRDLTRDQLADLVLVMAAQGRPDDTMRPQPHGAQHAIDLAVNATAAMHGCLPSEIAGQSRASHVTQARQIACWIAYDSGAATYSAIGRALNRDHTTVMYAVRKVENSHALLAMARTIRDGARAPGAA